MKVGFIGMGLMGAPMAKNILKKGFDLTVYNRTKSKTIELQKLGAKVANSPKDLASNVEVIITMVTGPKDVEEVLFGNDGVTKGAEKGLVVIDMSTIGPAAAKDIAQKLEKYGIGFLDAPVTGSTPGAINGTLTIFVGGKKNVFKKMRPVFMAMGTNLQYMGPTGCGQAIKLINNHLAGSCMTALAEGMLLADIFKLSRSRAAEALKGVPAVSPNMVLKLPSYVDGKFPLLFSIANMKKDLTLALAESKKAKMALPVLEKVQKLFEKAMKENLANEDFSAIIKVLK